VHVIKARNVNDALRQGLVYLKQHGVPRDSRNGPVLLAPEPVTTVYTHPLERVLFWDARDANPFFHLVESLWMLSGRNDVALVARFAKQMEAYSDNGMTFHGAYGYRWRKWFEFDQLLSIIESLKKNKDDRRQVLQMWDPRKDLGKLGKDFPCNVSATFQINTQGALDLAVFCRSNDIVWGAYGANAVHFSFLLEYMARAVGVPVGRYSQISINWHGYLETVNPLFEKLDTLPQTLDITLHSDAEPRYYGNPYVAKEVRPLLFPEGTNLDHLIEELLIQVENKHLYGYKDEFFRVASSLLFAHGLWQSLAAPERYDTPLFIMKSLDGGIDFVRACREWIIRRRQRWEAKMDTKTATKAEASS